MFLTTAQLHKRFSTSGNDIIENSIPEGYGKFSYDLRVDKIIFVDEEDKAEKEEAILSPGTTVFVATKECLKMPNDLIGIVTQKNSIIRRGLTVDAPVYHPGHHTRLFLRVTNISQNDIKIVEDFQIASIMFAQLTEEVEEYKGHFVNEFDFRDVGKYSNPIPQIIKVNEKVKNIEKIEKTIYERVILILSIFVGIFSLINLNAEFLKNDSIDAMLIFNLISIGGIGVFVSFIGLIIDSKNKSKWCILVISLIMILIGIILVA